MSTRPALGPKLAGVVRDMTRDQREPILKSVGTKLVPDVDNAVRTTPVARGSLADNSMSGWHGRQQGAQPVQIVGMVSSSASQVSIRPARMSRGPMRVLEEGRKAYSVGDFRISGSYTSKRTGITKARPRRVNRTVGATQGKGTWTRATEAVAQHYPSLMAGELRRVLNEHFKG